jgi:hypothetical protein
MPYYAEPPAYHAPALQLALATQGVLKCER